jgi:hypothetical protein
MGRPARSCHGADNDSKSKSIMHCPVTLVFERVPESLALEASVFDAIRHLEQFCDHIMSCHALIRGPEVSGDGIYVIDLKLRTPEREITIEHGGHPNPEHRNVDAALRDTFALARQELCKQAPPLCSGCLAEASQLAESR